jgi:2-C-methyl-D-erythritol 2,4-cyclodiphosphate synthase
MVRSRGAAVVNVDTVIVAEEPKMAPHIPAMKAALAPILGIPESSLGIKAKTNEGLGPVGEKRAISCYAVALIEIPG